MKIGYIEKVDKPSILKVFKKIKVEGDNVFLYSNLEKEQNIKKIINKLLKYEITRVVLSKELYENKNFINALKANNIMIFDGTWLVKYLALEILDYIIIKSQIRKEETELAITTNEIEDISIELIKILSKKYKKITVVTNYISKLQKLEREIYKKDGIVIAVSNNQKKSLLRSKIILNMDFNKEVFNKYKINEEAIIINMEGDMKIENKRFNGININDYEINVGREEVIWRENIKRFRTKDLFEAVLYMKDTFNNIRNKIKKDKVSIEALYGTNGKIERFS